jgi:ribulose-phosphate 3-epimerase
MTGPIAIAPSILSAGPPRLGEQVAVAVKAGTSRIHVDIMDGHFVPNLTFGPGTVAALAPLVHAARGGMECHLIVEEPIRGAGVALNPGTPPEAAEEIPTEVA